MSHVTLDIIAKESPHLSWIKDRTILVVRHGSVAYNTNIEGSDEDFKGVTIPPSKYFFGFNHFFEQAELKDPNPDTVIYNIRKFFGLAAACNPNIIEVLFTDPSDHMLVSPLGETLINHRNEFLSKRVKHTMCGYAYDQLRRIKLHRRWILNPPKHAPTREELGLPPEPLISPDHYAAVSAAIQKELEKYHFDFLDDCPEATKIAVKNAWHDMLVELRITSEDQWLCAARGIGLNDNFIEIVQQERMYRNKKDEWRKFLKWRAERNSERYALEVKFGYDTKHGYHLVRLMRMAREILTTGKVVVKRPDREYLLSVRRGELPFDDLVEYAERQEQELAELYKTTNVLPQKPDSNALDALCISIIDRAFETLIKH
jgi:uncharacterized protein